MALSDPCFLAFWEDKRPNGEELRPRGLPTMSRADLVTSKLLAMTAYDPLCEVVKDTVT